MQEQYNYEGEKFLDKLYKDLYNSEIVEHTKENSDLRQEAIKKYMDRLENTHKNATTENRKNMLKNLYYQKYIIKEENIPNNLSKEQKEKIIEIQKKSLDKWLDYLTDENARYPMWAKYWVFQGMLKMGTYDEAHEVYQNRSKKTLAPFVNVNPEIIAKAIEILENQLNKKEITDEEIKKVIETGNFSKIYTILEKKYKKNISINSNSNDGIWIKYNEGSREEAIKLSKSLEGKNTGWCTSSEQRAIDQVCGGEGYPGGDFYVYYTKDNENTYINPRIAIRMDGKEKIGEIRGIEESQNMEECMLPIIEEKLKKMQFLKNTDIEKYLQIIEDLKKLSIIYKKTIKKEELTLEEIINLYTKNHGFGWEEDPKVNKTIEKRYIENDYKIIEKEDKITKGKFLIKNIEKFPKDFKITDREFLQELLDYTGETIKFVPIDTPNYEEIALKAVVKSAKAFKKLPEDLQNNEEFIINGIKQNGAILTFTASKFKNKKNLAMLAVNNYGFALESLSDELKDDNDVVLTAINQNAISIAYASPRLKANKEFVLIAVKKDGFALADINPSLKKDNEVVLAAVQQNGKALKYADKNLKKDKEIVLAAIQQDAKAFEFADEELKNSPEFMEQVRIIIEQLEKKEESKQR